MATGSNNIGIGSKSGPSVARARLSTSMEPTLAGTSWSSFFDSKYSWNSARWARPSSSSYRTNRLTNTFESGSTSSAASSCSSSLRGQSPHSYTLPTTTTTLRSSERASSAATRPSNETATIRPNSRFGTSYHNSPSTFNGSSSSSTAATRISQSASGALSPRQEPLQRTSYPYRTIGINQSRAALVDMRQSLRPVKRQIVTDYKSVPRSSALASSAASTSTPLSLFTNAQIRTSSAHHHQSALSPVSPFPKCVSPPSMSRSSSTVTSPITTPITITTRPIPKSERPWRQKLADAQRLREAQAERSFGQHIPLDPYDTASRILAARSARRASIEQQQTQKQQNNEQQLEKEIAALKCYVSEPGALDKNATVAKFRQRMAEGQITASLTSPTAAATTNAIASTGVTSSSTPSTTSSTFSASSLLSRMPSLSRRSTTAVTKENLQEAKSSNAKDRPLSLIETPFGQRRLSVVKEATVAEIRPEEMSSMAKTFPEMDSSSVTGMKTTTTKKESPKTQRKNAAKEGGGGVNSTRPGSRASTASTVSTASPTVKSSKDKLEEKKNGKTTPLLSKRKKRDGGGEEQKQQKKATPPICEAVKEKIEKNPKPTLEKKLSNGEDEKGFNAVVQFKPQSLLRRKISTEEEGVKRKEPPPKTTPKWRKPPLERKISHEDSPKPVPGTWERTSKERFISQNKHLIRKTASASAVHTQKVRPLVRVCSARLKSSEDIQSLKSLQNAVKAKGSPTAAVLKMIKSIAKPKQRICAVAVVDKQFANKRSFRLGVRKTLLLKSVPQKLCTQLRCKSAQLLATTVRFNIVWKEQKKTENVTILLADWEHVASALIREPSSKKRAQQKSPLKRIQQELDKENLVGGGTGRPIIIGGKQQAGQKQKQIPSSTRQQQFPIGASLVAAAAGSITAAVAALSTGQTQQQKGPKPVKQQPQPLQKIPQLGEVPLILPDRSILEQFVQTKRDALERLREEAEGILEQTRGPVPPASTTLQLLPSTSSTENSVSLPGSKRNSQMLVTAMPPNTDAQLPQSLSNSFHAAVQATAADLRAQQQQMVQPTMARLRRPQQQPEMTRATLSTQTVQSFEKPKSLFEEQMQRQAIHLQQKAVRQSLHEPSAAERQAAAAAAAGMRRRSAAGEHADVAQSFVTQAQKPFQSEQRYAAHIPLSGRQSTASIESANSSTIDAATRQLDQMIDQARYKHSQQRNKFKEAIDYLDHIFEDFQREADLRQPPAKKPAPPPHQHQMAKPTTTVNMVQQQPPQMMEPTEQSSSTQIEPVQATFRAGNVKSARDAFEKVAAAIASEKKSSGAAAKLKKQTSAPTTQFSDQPQKSSSSIQRPEPFPVIVHPPSTTTNDYHQQQEEEASGEVVEIAETIVLPSKNTADRLDFTRNWLASGDVRTWAESSPRKGDQLLGQQKAQEDECYDSDEHSLGSCSAEVAAINAVNERKQQRQKLSKTMSMGAGGGGGGNGAKKKGTGATSLSHHQSLKNGTANGHQIQLRRKQPPSSSSVATLGVASVVVPPPQIAAPAPPSQMSGGQGGVSRPQPYRPQPQLGLLPPALAASGQMHKVPSIEQLRLRASQERACSQDYQSMGSSVHSQEGFRPQATYLSTHSLQRLGVGSGIGGAFHSYTPTMLPPNNQPHPHQYSGQHGGQYSSSSQSAALQLHQLKGSIQSLPDSALCTAPNAQTQPQMMGSTAAAEMAHPNYLQSTHHQHQSNTNRQQQFATLARMDNNNSNNNNAHQNNKQKQQHKSPQQQQYSTRGGGGAPAIPAHQSAANQNGPPPPPAVLLNEHALAIDALVAELELNTDSVQTTAEKRRSFPTMQTELALAKANQQAEKEGNIARGGGDQQQRNNGRRQQNGGGGSMSARNERRPMEEISEYIQKGRVGGNGRQKAAQNGTGPNRFETINSEKLSPSKVDAMARMFDKNGRNVGNGNGGCGGQQIHCFTNGTTTTSTNGEGNNGTMTTQNWATRRAATTGRIPSTNQQQRTGNGGGGGGGDEAGGKMMMAGNGGDSSMMSAGSTKAQQLRQPQPPPSHSAFQSSPRIVRGTRAGTKLGSTATTTALMAAERHHRGDTPTVGDDDQVAEDCNGMHNNGTNEFYENIQRQRLRPSPGYYSGGTVADDCSSISSQPGSAAVLPPTNSSGGKGAGAKIGQLIRKLGSVGSGGGGAKPPISAASMVSLNRVSNEPLGNGRSGGAIAGDGMLTKSNSLSGEPWKCQILGQQNGGRDHLTEDEDKPHNGIGNRLKQTIFGGMVRRRVPI